MLSVIVPVWNREKLVIRCLDSILSQTVVPDEIIVVDNDSSDQTYKKVEEWINIHRRGKVEIKLLKETKKGACFARQKGLENASGEYLIFFDSDDEMYPSLIEKVKNKIQQNPDADIICWKVKIKMLDGKTKVPPFSTTDPIENHLIHTLLRPQGHILKKRFLEQCGGWKKPIKVWDDLELGMRLLINKPKVSYIPEILALIYSQEESITGRDFSSKAGEWESILEVMENEMDLHPNDSQRRIKRILNYRRAILAAHYYREGNREAAEKLFKETTKGKTIMERTLLNFAYKYTGWGYRGAWRILGKFKFYR